MKAKSRTAFGRFLLLSLLCGMTLIGYAQEKTVSLRFKDASFVEVINKFREQTGTKFMYLNSATL